MFNALEVARQSILLHLRSRMMWLMFAGSLFAPLLILAIPKVGKIGGHQFFGVISVMAGLTFLLPLATLYLSTQMIQGDIEDRTSTYLFVRPIHRATVLVGKWLGATGIGVALLLCGATSLFTVIVLSGHEWKAGLLPDFEWWWVIVVGGSMMVVAYSAVGCLFGAFFKRPMLMGALFWFWWEQWLSRTPATWGLRNATVADPVRRWINDQLLPGGPVEDVLIPGMEDIDPTKLGLPEIALLKFTVITLGLALFIYSRREYDSRPRE